MADIRISARAYSKIMLHASKYPHCSINGVLLAEIINPKDDKKGKRLYIHDAVPLFHLCLQVSPMAEIALTQVDHMASKAGLVIAGYYLANENIRDLSFEKAGHRIADKIAENFSNACLIVVDNQRLSLTMENIAMCLYQYSEGKWKPKDRSCFSIQGNSLDTTASLLQQRVQDELVDFDNHLDDISLDWKNPHINKIVDTVMETYG